MKSPTKPTSRKRPDYERELRRAGVRITKPRRVIIDLLAVMEDHPDAMEIYRRAIAVDPTMSLSTVYRTMKLLEGFGAIHRHAFEGGPRVSKTPAASTTTISSTSRPAT